MLLKYEYSQILHAEITNGNMIAIITARFHDFSLLFHVRILQADVDT